MESKNGINRLLEMLENPEAYSEQEISEIINSDEETRGSYLTMVDAKRGYHGRKAKTTDVDKAWRLLEHKRMKHAFFYSRLRKMVAAIVALVVVSAIAFAAFSIARLKQTPQAVQDVATVKASDTTRPNSHRAIVNSSDTATCRTAATEPVVFDNIQLEQMLSEIAAYYGADVEFNNVEARQLRFHFVWHRDKGLDKVVEDLNHFESVDVAMHGQHITVE